MTADKNLTVDEMRLLAKAAAKASQELDISDVLRPLNVVEDVDLATAIVQIYVDLMSIVGGDLVVARAWLRGTNHAFDGRKPVDMMGDDAGLAQISDYLTSQRFGR
jgi:hypothetical protein